MNGIVEISIKDKKYTLQFGVQACMLFQDFAFKNALNPTSAENHVKLLGDLFYCGLVGYSLRMQQPVLEYHQAMDLYDQFAEDAKGFEEATGKMWKIYCDSKWGSDLYNFGQSVKKKLEESLP